MSFKDLFGGDGAFLTKRDFRTPKVMRISEVIRTGDRRAPLHLEFDGEPRRMRVTKTVFEGIEAVLGEDELAWVNHKIKIGASQGTSTPGFLFWEADDDE